MRRRGTRRPTVRHAVPRLVSRVARQDPRRNVRVVEVLVRLDVVVAASQSKSGAGSEFIML